MHLFVSLLPYFLALATIAAAAIDLYQKRKEYKNKRLRQAVIILFIATGVLTIFALHHDNAEKEADKQKAENANNALQAKVDSANNAQRDNTALFLKQFKAISDDVGNLKTQIRTDALQKKLESVQTELLNTQKAMAPGPKATLDFSFVPFESRSGIHGMVPRKSIELPVSADGSVHVDFSILNVTDVHAKSAQITLIICDQCKFAKEVGIYASIGGQPGVKMLEKAPGEPDTHRHLFLDGLSAAGYLPTMHADIIPPSTATQFDLGIGYACETCVVGGGSFGTVRIMKNSNRPIK
jgi:hypothetical protein